MNPTKVFDIDPANLETVAKGDGGAVQDLPVFVIEGMTFSRWKVSDEERAAIVAGADILVAVMNGPNPLAPMLPVAMVPDVALEPDHLVALAVELCKP